MGKIPGVRRVTGKEHFIHRPCLAVQTKTFSPKELAAAVGVSESSIKRWSDAGLIQMTRTVGGHRRIARSEAVNFIRAQQLRVVNPGLLGLVPVPEMQTPETTTDKLYQALKRGDVAEVRGLITGAYLSGDDFARFLDGPLTQALERVGMLWLDDERGIYQEHVATTICIEALSEVRVLMPSPAEGAPVAVGGAPEHDPYLLPGMMVAAVLADAGYIPINLGPQTPSASFHHAVADHQPGLVWIAATSPLTEEAEALLIRDLAVPLQQQGVEVVIGGRSVKQPTQTWPSSVHVLDSMVELAALVKGE